MSLKIMPMVWDDDEISTPVEIAIMLALADYANDEGQCWPSIPTIIQKSRCCRGTVWRVIQGMVEKKKLSYIPGGGAGRSNRYQFRLSETVQQMNRSRHEPFTGRTKTVHAMNKNSSPGEPDPSGTVRNPQLGGTPAAHPPRNKLTPQQLFWMINERLKTAKGSLKTKLESERDLCLAAASGIDLTPAPPKTSQPTLIVLPDPPTEAEWKAGIDALKAVVDEARTPMPNKPVLREIRFKRKLKA